LEGHGQFSLEAVPEMVDMLYLMDSVIVVVALDFELSL